MDKAALTQQLRDQLQRTLAGLQREQGAAVSGTRVDGDHRPENRGERAAVTSAGYLSMGLGARAAELEEQLRLVDLVDPGPRTKVVTGALALVAHDGERQVWYLLLPGGQGARLEGTDAAVVALSPDSPLARALWGLAAGEEATTTVGGRVSELEVLEVG